MNVVFHRNFKRQYKKLRISEQRKCDERIALFMQNQQHPILNNHSLSGKLKEYWSINITGDLRALYELVSEDTALFIAIDAHSNLYS